MMENLNLIVDQNKNLMETNKLLEEQLTNEKKERMELEERFFQIIIPIEIERSEKNLELHGLPEKKEEESMQVVKNIISNVTTEPVEIAACFRYGRKTTLETKEQGQ